MIIDIFNSNDIKILNNCWRFCKDKYELNQLCHYRYFTTDESSKLYNCCKESLQNGKSNCSECGEDLRYIADNDTLEIDSHLLFPKKSFTSKEEFEKFYIKYNDLSPDFFDDIDLNVELYMDILLYLKTEKYLEDKGLL